MYMYFFFGDTEPSWWPYRDQLGIQAVVDYLDNKGLPSEWPTNTVDLSDPATIKENVTKSSYESRCPYYGGYWLCGGAGSVECKAFGEMLPGVVWYKTCMERHKECPFYVRGDQGK